MVTLILKNEEAKYMKDYRPIYVCTTMYKIISKVLTARLGLVLGSVIGKCQGAFVPGQQIHSYILLTYKLIKGYTRKDGPPKCMMQLDLQKAYDMVD